MRKACPEIVKKQHSDGVSYKYAKIYDVWEKITPIMNELGVDFDVISEQATRHAENGDPVYWITMQTKTRNGDKLMFLYEADLTIRWLNLDNDDETIEATVHAVGWNDDPAKAKGLGPVRIVVFHQIRNAIIPMITNLGTEIAGMLMGSYVIEKIFSIPGMGAYFVDSIQGLDYTMVMGLVIFQAVIVIAANFIVDLLYGIIDPRIRVR